MQRLCSGSVGGTHSRIPGGGTASLQRNAMEVCTAPHDSTLPSVCSMPTTSAGSASSVVNWPTAPAQETECDPRE